MKLIAWEFSFGLFTGILLGYRQYVDEVELKVDHVIYVGLFDCCITLHYE
jgi:hypothetical protein|tara:strand:+ start:2002 stop:2151 length:150 start_codon:yes stop_codon:yes gene_type:complete